MSSNIQDIIADHEARIQALEKLKKSNIPDATKINLTPEQIGKLLPRVQAQRITAMLDKPHFIGKMSDEAINTELKALTSGFDDSVLTPQEKLKRDKRVEELKAGLKKRGK